jgi:hypothetical protein
MSGGERQDPCLPEMDKLFPEATKAFWAYDKAALAGGAILKCIGRQRLRRVSPSRNWPKPSTSRVPFANQQKQLLIVTRDAAYPLSTYYGRANFAQHR